MVQQKNKEYFKKAFKKIFFKIFNSISSQYGKLHVQKIKQGLDEKGIHVTKKLQ